jgi:insulysin
MSKSVDSIMLCAATNIAPEHVHRALVPSRGVNLVYRPLVPSAENVNSAIVAFYYIEPVSDHTAYTQLQLFSQLLSQPIFSELRTKQQLGYIVSSGALSFNHTHSGFRVVVQSERTGEYLEDRVEELWRTTAQEYLKNLTEEDFAKQRSSLIEKKLERAKNSTQE